MIDCVIAGAGFAGAVFARELAEAGRRVLVVERRSHLGGNCHDARDEHGVLVHRYGPHLFHTDDEEVFRYLGRFTQWQEYEHRVLAHVDGQRIPVPFNLNSLHLLFPCAYAQRLEERLVSSFGFGARVSILALKETDDPELSRLARYIYDRIFVNYTVKQWGCTPEEIDAEVMARVPVVISRDDRYFQDRFQAVPCDGYASLFARLFDHPRIHLLLNTDFKDVFTLDVTSGAMTLLGSCYDGDLVYTGMVDALFDYCHGRLPYRALRFCFQSLEQEYFQQAAVENYPNNYNFTRITEFKRIHGQGNRWTTILREFPHSYDPADAESIPCYPMFNQKSRQCYEQYSTLAARIAGLVLVGRLAEYRYYDMDDIVARVLALARERIARGPGGVR